MKSDYLLTTDEDAARGQAFDDYLSEVLVAFKDEDDIPAAMHVFAAGWQAGREWQFYHHDRLEGENW